MTVADNLKVVEQKIKDTCLRADRDPKDVKIVAVTKYVSIETALEAIQAGINHLGENRDTGMLEKYETIGGKAVWHFIGTLQSKKVKQIIDKVDYIHSLDRLSLAKEINKRSSKKIRCFVQVNASGEKSKHGLAPEEVIPFIQQLNDFTMIEIVGLMTMAPNTEDTNLIRSTFQKVKSIQKDVQALQLPYAPCKDCSMGMSNDFEIAIEEGATYIRLGSTLVGKEM